MLLCVYWKYKPVWPFSRLAVRVISGHELAASVIMSQVISNVPAALLLSNFTQQWEL